MQKRGYYDDCFSTKYGDFQLGLHIPNTSYSGRRLLDQDSFGDMTVIDSLTPLISGKGMALAVSCLPS